MTETAVGRQYAAPGAVHVVRELHGYFEVATKYSIQSLNTDQSDIMSFEDSAAHLTRFVRAGDRVFLNVKSPDALSKLEKLAVELGAKAHDIGKEHRA